jgi:hypothetical protein
MKRISDSTSFYAILSIYGMPSMFVRARPTIFARSTEYPKFSNKNPSRKNEKYSRKKKKGPKHPNKKPKQ